MINNLYSKVITTVIVETDHILVINCVKKICTCVDEIIRKKRVMSRA